jgi:hypothetical protein
MKHQFVSAVADGADATQVRPQANWNAPHVVSYRTLSANTTLSITDDGILASGTINITLPKISTVYDGQPLWIKNVGSGVISILPDATIPDTINNGLTSWSLPNQNNDVELIASASQVSWQVKGQ